MEFLTFNKDLAYKIFNRFGLKGGFPSPLNPIHYSWSYFGFIHLINILYFIKNKNSFGSTFIYLFQMDNEGRG